MRSDELDKILDSALSSYSQEEARPGLETRVLSRIRASGQARRFAWLRWAVTIPAFAALLLLVFWISDASKPARSTVKDSAATLQYSTVFQSRDRKGAVSRIQKHLAAAIRPSAKHVPLPLPKHEQFPTPTPLTDEERALLAFVACSPKQAEEVLADAKSRITEPIQIKEIQIEPLQDGGQE